MGKRSVEKRDGCRIECTETEPVEDKEAGTISWERKCEPTPECTVRVPIPAGSKRSFEKRGKGCTIECTESEPVEDKEAGTISFYSECNPTPECTVKVPIPSPPARRSYAKRGAGCTIECTTTEPVKDEETGAITFDQTCEPTAACTVKVPAIGVRSLEKRGKGCTIECTDSEPVEDKEAGTISWTHQCEPSPECTVTVPAIGV